MRVRIRSRWSVATASIVGFLAIGLPDVLGLQITVPVTQRARTTARRLLLQQVRVKPEMIDQFVYLQRTETVPALKKAGIAWREVYQTTTVGRTGLFAFLTEITGMQQFDGATPVQRALGDGYAAYQRKLRTMIQESQSSIIRTRPELSMIPSARLVPRLAVVARIETQPGKHQEFESWLRGVYLDVVRKSNCRAFWVSQTVLGGSGSEYWTLTFGDSFAAFDDSPMMRVLGSDGADMLSSQPASFVTRVERWIVRYRDDLSFVPAVGRDGQE